MHLLPPFFQCEEPDQILSDGFPVFMPFWCVRGCPSWVVTDAGSQKVAPLREARAACLQG